MPAHEALKACRPAGEELCSHAPKQQHRALLSPVAAEAGPMDVRRKCCMLQPSGPDDGSPIAARGLCREASWWQILLGCLP